MIDLEKLSIAVRSKRGRRSLEDVADEIPTIHVTTLNRIENCKVKPDLDTFTAICDWLDVSMDFFRTEEDPDRAPAA